MLDVVCCLSCGFDMMVAVACGCGLVIVACGLFPVAVGFVGGLAGTCLLFVLEAWCYLLDFLLPGVRFCVGWCLLCLGCCYLSFVCMVYCRLLRGFRCDLVDAIAGSLRWDVCALTG